MAKKPRQLTELQEGFLNALFGAAAGDPRTAMRIAGYADTVTIREVMTALRDEIVDASKNFLALNAPKATFKMLSVLDDPSQAGSSNIIKAAQQILDRAGAKAPEEGNGLKIPAGGLFILPAKNIVSSPFGENIQNMDGFMEAEDDSQD